MRRKTEIFLFVGIIILGFVFRGYRLTTSPAGLYIDETSIGYNAYSLLKTGKDEHGKSWPLFFEAFGEWKLPVYIYSVYLTQLVIGPTDLSIRLPAVVYGTLTIPALYLWVYYTLKKKDIHLAKTAALVGCVLLAISPWHYYFSRPGHEAAAALFFLVVGLACFYKALSGRPQLLPLTYVCFVCALYSYNSARIVIPVMGGLLFLLYRKQFRIKIWLISAAVLLLSLPFWRFALSDAGWVRFQQTSILAQHDKPFLTNYWLNISPKTLFFVGDIVDKQIPIGLHYWIELPFFIFGLLVLCLSMKKKQYLKETIVIFALLSVGCIPAAITIQNPMALRTLLALPASLFLSAFGIAAAVTRLTKRDYQISVIILLSLNLCLLFVQFLHRYDMYVQLSSERVWQIAKKQTLLTVKEHASKYWNIYLSPSLRDINAAWYLQFVPSAFWQHSYRDERGTQYYFVDTQDQISVTNRPLLWVTSDEHQIEGTLVTTIYEANGRPAYFLWEL